MKGDVSFNNNIPRMWFGGKFQTICGLGFWDNQIGASLFCKKLGYDSGEIKMLPGQSSSMNYSLVVGKCIAKDESLATCGRYQHVTYEIDECSKGKTFSIDCKGDATKASKVSCQL